MITQIDHIEMIVKDVLRDPDGWRLQVSDKKRKEPEKGIAEEDVVEKL